MKTFFHLWLRLAEFFLQLSIFQTNAVDKIKTQMLRPVHFSENRALNEVKWKNAVQPDRSQTVAYPGILFGGGVQQIQLRTEDRENEDLGAIAP